jgi:hypothetical protein
MIEGPEDGNEWDKQEEMTRRHIWAGVHARLFISEKTESFFCWPFSAYKEI